ncbi:MAG: VPDSG-CTERM sorting domain-containing protein, partial [Verrucomicrobiae bacterium]|nr:VPDSG-CTERM sorting domain-containing protein [Verrucomicrobiae bacterium]
VTGLPVGAAGVTYDLFGWDMALVVNWANLTFDVVQLNFTGGTDGSRVQVVKFGGGHQLSNPYKYYDQGTILFDDVALSNYGWTPTWSGLSEWGEPAVGHYYAAFDLGSLGLSFRKVHLTQECGNDDMYGQVPDAGATIALLGIALLGLAGLARKLS